MGTSDIIKKKMVDLESRKRKHYAEISSATSSIHTLEQMIATLNLELETVIPMEMADEFTFKKLNKKENVKWKLTLDTSKRACITPVYEQASEKRLRDEIHQLYITRSVEGKIPWDGLKMQIGKDITLETGWSGVKIIMTDPKTVGVRIKELGIKGFHRNDIETKFKSGKMAKYLRDTGEVVLKSMKIETTC